MQRIEAAPSGIREFLPHSARSRACTEHNQVATLSQRLIINRKSDTWSPDWKTLREAPLRNDPARLKSLEKFRAIRNAACASARRDECRVRVRKVADANGYKEERVRSRNTDLTTVGAFYDRDIVYRLHICGV